MVMTNKFSGEPDLNTTWVGFILCQATFYIASFGVIASFNHIHLADEAFVFTAVSLGLNYYARYARISEAYSAEKNQIFFNSLAALLLTSNVLSVVCLSLALRNMDAEPNNRSFKNGRIVLALNEPYFRRYSTTFQKCMYIVLAILESSSTLFNILAHIEHAIVKPKTAADVKVERSETADATESKTGDAIEHWSTEWLPFFYSRTGLLVTMVHVCLRLAVMVLDIPLIVYAETPFFFAIVSYFVLLCDLKTLYHVGFMAWNILGVVVSVTGFAFAVAHVLAQQLPFANAHAYHEHILLSKDSGHVAHFSSLNLTASTNEREIADVSATLHGIYAVHVTLCIGLVCILCVEGLRRLCKSPGTPSATEVRPIYEGEMEPFVQKEAKARRYADLFCHPISMVTDEVVLFTIFLLTSFYPVFT